MQQICQNIRHRASFRMCRNVKSGATSGDNANKEDNEKLALIMLSLKAVHRRHGVFSCEQAYQLLGRHWTNPASACGLRQIFNQPLLVSLIPDKHDLDQ